MDAINVVGDIPIVSNFIIEIKISLAFLLVKIVKVSLKLFSKHFLIGKYELIKGIDNPEIIPNNIFILLKKKGITKPVYELNRYAT